jgi:outer membrane cobalamin receptor
MAGDNPRVQPEAIRQVGGAVELAAADVNPAFRRFAKRNDSRVQPVNQGSKGNKIQTASVRYA